MEHSDFALGDVEPQVTLDEWVDLAEEVLRGVERVDPGGLVLPSTPFRGGREGVGRWS